MSRQVSKAERQEAVERLREAVKPGDTLFTILRHVSRSGMQRVIDVVKIEKDGTVLHLSWNIAKAVGYTFDREREGLKAQGCGMDTGFSVVYNLARTLWPNGVECTGKSCPSNDHSNGDRDYSPHMHQDGGYALNHRWL